MSGIATAVVGSAVIGAGASAYASNKASNQASNASKRASKIAQEAARQARADVIALANPALRDYALGVQGSIDQLAAGQISSLDVLNTTTQSASNILNQGSDAAQRALLGVNNGGSAAYSQTNPIQAAQDWAKQQAIYWQNVSQQAYTQARAYGATPGQAMAYSDSKCGPNAPRMRYYAASEGGLSGEGVPIEEYRQAARSVPTQQVPNPQQAIAQEAQQPVNQLAVSSPAQAEQIVAQAAQSQDPGVRQQAVELQQLGQQAVAQAGGNQARPDIRNIEQNAALKGTSAGAFSNPASVAQTVDRIGGGQPVPQNNTLGTGAEVGPNAKENYNQLMGMYQNTYSELDGLKQLPVYSIFGENGIQAPEQTQFNPYQTEAPANDYTQTGLTGIGVARGDIGAGLGAAIGASERNLAGISSAQNQALGVLGSGPVSVGGGTGWDTGYNALRSAEGKGLDEIRRGTEQAIGFLNPYQEQGAAAYNLEAAMSGALGPEAQAQAMQNYSESPGQAYLREQQERALLRNSAAIGGLGGGNVRTALQEQAMGIAATDQQRYIENLRALGQSGMAAATQQGGFAQTGGVAGGQHIGQLAQAAAGLAGQQGAASAASARAAAALSLQKQTAAAQLIMQAAGMQSNEFGNQQSLYYGAGQDLAQISGQGGQQLAGQISGNAAGQAALQTGLGTNAANVIGATSSGIANNLNQAGATQAQIRQDTGNTLGNIAVGAGSQAAAYAQNAGNAQAAGTIGIGNAIAGGINQIGQAAGYAFNQYQPTNTYNPNSGSGILGVQPYNPLGY